MMKPDQMPKAECKMQNQRMRRGCCGSDLFSPSPTLRPRGFGGARSAENDAGDKSSSSRRPDNLQVLHFQFAVGMWHFALCLVFLLAASTHADEAIPSKPPVVERTTVKQERYLGVVTESVPEALAAQLKDRLAAGHGLVVKRVLPDSPAAKAGIRPFDVLTAADGTPLGTPDQLKKLVTLTSAGRMLRLELIRETKAQTVDVLPGQRMVSRMIHRHAGAQPGNAAAESTAAADREDAANEPSAELPAYSVGVQTRDGRQFQVEVRMPADGVDDVLHKASGTSGEIAARLKALPQPVRHSVLRQITRISEDRQTLRTVQFRFQPRRQGHRQVMTATLRKPQSDGAIKSFEWQQPMPDAAETVPLQKLLDTPAFTAELKDLDPAVRHKIEAALKTAALPAGTLRIESSQ